MKPLALALTLTLAAAALGDVTIKQTTTGKGLGMAASGSTTTYIKGMKMRSDVDLKGTVMTTIFDVEAQKMIVFDSKKKNADVWDMQAFGAELQKSVATGKVKTSVKANDKTKEVAGKTANGFDLSSTVPATVGGEGGMAMTVVLTGPMWVVKGAPGTEDYANFYKAAAEKGFIFTDPRAAKGSPGQAKAMAEMYRLLATTGGVPYETDLKITVEGEGPMAAMMGKMGNMSMTSTVQSIDTAALDDALFAPPAGYKLTPKK